MYNITKAIGGLGLLAIIFSFCWHMAYPNPSQFYITSFIGIIFIVFASYYEWIKRLKIENEGKHQMLKMEIEEQNQRIDSMDLWMNKKLNKLK